MTRRGFTLVETLVVIAVVAVLTAIAIPTLQAIFGNRHEVQNLARMRQTMQDFFVYANQRDGRMVNAGLPDDPEADWFYSLEGGTLNYQASVYISQEATWPRVLLHAFGEAHQNWQSTLHDYTLGGRFPSGIGDRDWRWSQPSDFTYSPTMFTKPGAWVTPGLGLNSNDEYAEWFEVVDQTDIRHPAGKGVLLHTAHHPPKREMAFADGSVSVRDLDEARTPAVPPPALPHMTGRPVLHTADGYLGIDY